MFYGLCSILNNVFFDLFRVIVLCGHLHAFIAILSLLIVRDKDICFSLAMRTFL